MLSAEHYALEHAAVQQLLNIREREVSHMTNRFNALGTQSSLLAGFIVTTLTAVDTAGTKTVEGVRQAFWASSALALACAMHCIITSTFAAVWGPGLALRGPEGSVSKAYWGMTRERYVTFVPRRRPGAGRGRQGLRGSTFGVYTMVVCVRSCTVI